MNKAFDIFAGLAAIAMVTTIVSHKYTGEIISAAGGSYAEALRTAIGAEGTVKKKG